MSTPRPRRDASVLPVAILLEDWMFEYSGGKAFECYLYAHLGLETVGSPSYVDTREYGTKSWIDFFFFVTRREVAQFNPSRSFTKT